MSQATGQVSLRQYYALQPDVTSQTTVLDSRRSKELKFQNKLNNSYITENTHLRYKD